MEKDRNIYVFTECIYVIESKSPLNRKAWKFLATYINICPLTGTPTLGELVGKRKTLLQPEFPKFTHENFTLIQNQ